MKVSAHKARAILALAPNEAGSSPDKKDAQTLRTVLSLIGLPSGLKGHLVAEMRDIDNEPLIRVVGGSQIETLVSHDMIGRLMLMSTCMPGLASVFHSTLGFAGHEFYAKEWPEVVGLEFDQLQQRFPEAIVIGIEKMLKPGNVAPKHRLILNPPGDLEIKKGDKIIVIAEDDDTYSPKDPSVSAVATEEDLPATSGEDDIVEKFLMTGWRRDIRDLISLLDHMVNPGSELHLFAELPADRPHLSNEALTAYRNTILENEGLDLSSLINVRLVHHQGNSACRKDLVRCLDLETFTGVMILADEMHESNVMHSDSHNLATLLLIRDIQQRNISKMKGLKRRRSLVRTTTGAHNVTTRPSNKKRGLSQGLQKTSLAEIACPIICEILDSRTQKSISMNPAISSTSDFVQSNQMISQVLAMICEDRNVTFILQEILGGKGSMFQIKPHHEYVRQGEIISFMGIAMRAQLRGEILCGYQDPTGTWMNPDLKHRPKGWDSSFMVVLCKPKWLSQKTQKPVPESVSVNLGPLDSPPPLASDTVAARQPNPSLGLMLAGNRTVPQIAANAAKRILPHQHIPGNYDDDDKTLHEVHDGGKEQSATSSKRRQSDGAFISRLSNRLGASAMRRSARAMRQVPTSQSSYDATEQSMLLTEVQTLREQMVGMRQSLNVLAGHQTMVSGFNQHHVENSNQ